MKIIDNVYDFFQKNSKLTKIVAISLVSVLYVGSVAISVFSGGEFFKEDDTVKDVKGLLNVEKCDYRDRYISGDTFFFDKANSKIGLYAKDPEIESMVTIDDLPSSEYGFRVNGVDEIYLEASDITMTTDIKTIDVVSVVYPNLKVELPVTVLNGIDETKLVSSLTLEAETDADVYRSDVLLTREELKTQPASDKPYISSEGTVVDGTSCSGGACLRNFQTSDMRVSFTIVAKEEIDTQLTVMVCKRKESATFGNWYKVTLNDETISSVESQTIQAGTGYFEPFTLQAVTVRLLRGINVISFASGSRVGTSNPGNLDGIKLEAATASIGSADAMIE